MKRFRLASLEAVSYETHSILTATDHAEVFPYKSGNHPINIQLFAFNGELR